jgi:hypothetical protein
VLRADDTAVRVDADPEAPFLGIGVKRLQAKTAKLCCEASTLSNLNKMQYTPYTQHVF